MFTGPRRNIATKITQKFRPNDLAAGDYRCPFTMSGLWLTLVIKLKGNPVTIAVYIETGHETELCVRLNLINNDPLKSISYDNTRVVPVPGGSGRARIMYFESALDRNEGWLDSNGYLTVEAKIWEPPNSRSIKNLGAQSDLIENVFKYARSVKDLTVCSADGREYKMSEYIFACHSPPLAKFLEYKENGRVIFKDFKSNVMDEFIFYLRNGLIRNSAESVAFDLAELAHRYELQPLFDLVEPLLVNQVESGQLTRIMKVATLFDSTPLYEAIGKIEKISEQLLSAESENFTIEVKGETLSINQTILALNYPHLVRLKDEMTTALQGTTLEAAKGLIDFLKTSQLKNLPECLSEYASLARALHLPEISKLVEGEITSNISKYDRDDVKDLAVRMKSLKIFRALALDFTPESSSSSSSQ